MDPSFISLFKENIQSQPPFTLDVPRPDGKPQGDLTYLIENADGTLRYSTEFSLLEVVYGYGRTQQKITVYATRKHFQEVIDRTPANTDIDTLRVILVQMNLLEEEVVEA